MTNVWTNSETHEFIDLYKSEPILWDPKHPLKRSRPEVTDAWIRIQKAFSLQCSVTNLKKKKESLMTGFRAKVQKKRNDENYTPSWFAYDQMASFLGEFYEGNGGEIKHEGDSLDTTYYEEINDTSDIVLEPSSAKKSRKRKHNNKDCGDRFIAPEFVQFNEDENEKDNNNKIDDVCNIFCQLLALKLQKLDEYDRDIAMHEIDKIMFIAKMKKCRKPIGKEETQRCRSESLTLSELGDEHNLSDE